MGKNANPYFGFEIPIIAILVLGAVVGAQYLHKVLPQEPNHVESNPDSLAMQVKELANRLSSLDSRTANTLAEFKNSLAEIRLASSKSDLQPIIERTDQIAEGIKILASTSEEISQLKQKISTMDEDLVLLKKDNRHTRLPAGKN
jgi:hypothetical protein